MELHFVKLANRLVKHALTVLVVISIMLADLTIVHAEATARIAVIYPNVREPYIRIFREIISGISEALPHPAKQISINRDTHIDDMKSQLDKHNVDSVIILGSRAQKMSSILAQDRTVLTGAVFSTPSTLPLQFSNISMIASPTVLLEKLITLAPEVKTVHVVYNKQKDMWMIRVAEQVLKQHGVTLNALPSENIRSHARLYNELFKRKSLSHSDAVWLLQSDSSLKEPGIFAMILKSAWNQRFVVFSANPTHVQKGALFAMYPDNQKLGNSLAKKMLSLHNGGSHSTSPLKDLLVAVNIRTAKHLDLDFSRSERQSFNMVFPSR